MLYPQFIHKLQDYGVRTKFASESVAAQQEVATSAYAFVEALSPARGDKLSRAEKLAQDLGSLLQQNARAGVKLAEISDAAQVLTDVSTAILLDSVLSEKLASAAAENSLKTAADLSRQVALGREFIVTRLKDLFHA